MDAYKDFIDPTRVSQCHGCNFITPNKKHLVVGKASILQIFEILKVNRSYKLNLVEQYKLSGTITDIKPIRTTENIKLDYLLISTKFAKLSLIKWDHKLHSIQTVSLHYYENVIENMTFEKLNESELIVEPKNSCVCLRFKNILTFLPFKNLDDYFDEMDDDEAETDNKSKLELYDNSSFLINGQNLDSRIGHIIDMQFLHNYREPTIGILCLNQHLWTGGLYFKKDNISYIVLSLDLKTKSSTTVLKIDSLPYDIDRMIPLPNPLNGSLLVGCNELIHVDNGGICRRVAVNKYTALTTNTFKNFADNSHLDLQLENCSVIQIPNDNKVLIILKTGEFYYLNFEMDGKTIKKVSLEAVQLNENIQLTFPSEIAALDNNLLFVGNLNGNSPLVEWVYDKVNEEVNGSVKDKGDDMDEDEDNVDDDEDIYDDEDHSKIKYDKGSINFKLHDELINHGPISNFTLGFYSTERYKSNLINPNYQEVSIFSNSGSHKQSHLNIFTPSVQLTIKSSLTFSTINKMWITNNFLITSDDKNRKSEIFQINKNYNRLNAKSFVNNDLTIAIHELNNGKFVLQITPKEIRIYDSRFKKKMTLNSELKNNKDDEIFNSFCMDELLMIFLTNGEVMIFAINTYNETFKKIPVPKILSDTLITTGYITNSNILNAVLKDVNLLIKNRKRKFTSTSTGNQGDLNFESSEKELGPKQKVFILVTGDNRIVLFNRFHNERCYQLNDISKFTEQLQLSFFENTDTYPDPFIKQVIFNEIGDEIHKSQYLTILTMGGEVYLYKLYFDGENFRFLKEKDLLITGAPHDSYSINSSIERKLFYVENLNNFTGIFVSGQVPYFVSKSSHAIPKIFKFTQIPIMAFAKFSNNDLIFLDDKKNARICEIPKDFNYENNWPVKRISFDETIKSVTYHESSNTFLISTYKDIPYNCLDEENRPIVGTMEDKPPATSMKGSIKLVSPINWTVIDEFELEDNEVAMNIKSMILDVGSSTRRFKTKKELVVIGTGKYRMEDLAANGSFKVYEIIDIIPDPNRPETNHKLKEFYSENTKGAVTSISELCGRFVVAQGQKIIVRDLQDDGVVPVAFYDFSVYVSEAKNFGNFVLLGDTLKSVWLLGFDAEPFRMLMLGKDLKAVDVSCADFIVKDEEIFMLVGDNNNILHLLKYDPEDPESSNGQRLITKASFNVNCNITCLRQLPMLKNFNNFQTIGSSIEGSFFTVFPIDESTYRRMYILQQQLTDREYHYCGLNPRLNRSGGLKFNTNDANNKPILDYETIKSFAKLNDDRKRNLASKVSKNNQDIWKDILDFENILSIV